MGRKRGNTLPPWHPKILIPSILVGLPLSYLLRYALSNVPKEWRSFPAKLPHLILLWIQQLITWTSERFALQTLVFVWLGLLLLIYFLPSANRPDFEEMKLNRELEQLEREVKDLAEEFGDYDEPQVKRSKQAKLTAIERKKQQ